MGVLREYHEAMGQLILEHEGTLERFAGDGMMEEVGALSLRGLSRPVPTFNVLGLKPPV